MYGYRNIILRLSTGCDQQIIYATCLLSGKSEYNRRNHDEMAVYERMLLIWLKLQNSEIMHIDCLVFDGVMLIGIKYSNEIAILRFWLNVFLI